MYEDNNEEWWIRLLYPIQWFYDIIYWIAISLYLLPITLVLLVGVFFALLFGAYLEAQYLLTVGLQKIKHHIQRRHNERPGASGD